MPARTNIVRVLVARVPHHLAVKVIRARRHYFAALFTHDRYGEPRLVFYRARYILQNTADVCHTLEREFNVLVHLTRLVELGGAVVFGRYARFFMDGDKFGSKIFSIVFK